jgi:transcriptional regulator of acetoin/glycerol metabolism
LILLDDWAENLRGLDRLIHQVSDFIGSPQPLAIDELPDWFLPPQAPQESISPRRRTTHVGKPVAPENGAELQRVLDECGSVRAAAKFYGRDRRQIYRWMKALGVARE